MFALSIRRPHVLRRFRSVGCCLIGLLVLPSPANGEKPRSLATEEIWQVHFMQGAKAGYSHTTVRLLDGPPRRQVETVTALSVKRFGQENQTEMRTTSVEAAHGALISFESSTSLGSKPSRISGEVRGDRLELRSDAEERASSRAWKKGTLGFAGVERSLELRPMKPGERRDFDLLVPLLLDVGHVELVAHDYQETKLLSGSQKLLKISSILTLAQAPGAPLDETLWATPDGRILKQRSEAMQQETYRTTREVALSKTAAVSLDLGLDTFVKVNRPIAERAKLARYRVRIENSDPVRFLASSSTQRVKRLGQNEVELTVYASGVSPGDPKAETAPSRAALEPSVLIQSNDPTIKQMAREAVAAESEPARRAAKLERYVQQAVKEKNFSSAFSSAAEVAKTRQGDCTEHAVLLAALARALEIPSRVAIGLVYVRPAQAFGFHMWTEVYVDGDWRGLDGTLGQGGTTAGHIKLLDTTLAGDSPYAAFLPVAQVLGRIKIDVLDVE